MKKLKLASALLLGAVPFTAAISNDINPPEDVLGFFQSYDSPSPETWYFNTIGEGLADSGYSILIDGFWVNYPFCWGDGSGIPGQGSPIPVCHGIVHEPGPGLSTEIYHKFWDNYSGAMGPDIAGEEYNNYWTSVHNGGPSVISKIRTEIDIVNPIVI